jgi:hypothetical protein
MFFDKKRLSLMFILLFHCQGSTYGNPNLEAVKEVSLPASTYIKTSLKLFSPSDSFFNFLDLAAIALNTQLIIKTLTTPPPRYLDGVPRQTNSPLVLNLFFIALSFGNIISNYSRSIENQKKRRKLTAEQLAYEKHFIYKADKISLPVSTYFKATLGLVSSASMIVSNCMNVAILWKNYSGVRGMVNTCKANSELPKAIPFSALFFVGAVGQIVRNYNRTIQDYKIQKMIELELKKKQSQEVI